MKKMFSLLKPSAVSIACIFLLSVITGAETREIEVKQGDTLYGIARTYLGDSKRWNEIAALNGISAPYNVKAGQMLMLPDTISRVLDVERRENIIPPTNSNSRDTVEMMNHSAHQEPIVVESGEALTDGAGDDTGQQKNQESFVPDYVEPLSQLLVELNAKNPTIRAFEEAAKAAAFRPSQAGSLPDPMLRFAVRFDEAKEVMVDNGMASIRTEKMTMPMLQVSQMIPVGKLSPMKTMEERMAEAKREMIGLERTQMERMLKNSYAELYYVDRAEKVLEEIEEILKMIVGSTEAMYRVGNAEQSDLLRAHLEISMIKEKKIMLEGKRRDLTAMINALLDRPADSLVGTPEELLPYILEEESILEASPQVKVAAAELAASKAKVDVARSMFIPDLELMGGIMTRPELNPRYEIGIGISLPIWSGTKQTPALREAERIVKQREEELRAIKANVRSRITSALAMMNSAYRTADLNQKTIIPQARLTLDASLSHYKAGSVDFMTVAENAVTLMNYELAKIEAVQNFYKNAAMFEEAAGIKLDWRTK